MGLKTTGLDLDNAWVRFSDFRVPHASLLDRHGGVDAATGAYLGAAKKPMEMIGQRLFTGRVAVAQAALVFSRTLFLNTKKYSDGKMCAMRGTTPALSDVPQLRALYDEAEKRFARMESFVNKCETGLCAALVADETPKLAATRAIAVAKIRAVETCVELCHRLKQEVGSYALMADTGFEHTDFLQCCKFAEGDSRILSQKLARDAFGEWLRNEKKSAQTGVPQPPNGWSPQETRACARVAAAIQAAEKKGASKIEAWDAAWRDVYALADAVCARAMAGTLGETIDAKL
jgi:alkylation response protein AidB-like acyl-CoA dehydrogenase